MKIRVYLVLFFVALCVNIFAQNVSDVAFYQEGKNIVVTYSLDKTADVSLQVSTDGGMTYSAPLKHVSGDVGKGVSAGEKQIVWDVLAEYDSFTGDNVVFLVKAIGETHKYVDLGLPSGTLWAECNIGAKSPADYGDYFAWGETSTKESYTEKTYTVDYNITSLDAAHDAATANWGEHWRMPTAAEQEELHRECTWTWTTFHGKNGYRVTGKNGKSIFLPAAGAVHANKRDWIFPGKGAGYFSSSTYDKGKDRDSACSLRFNVKILESYWPIRKYYGYTIRPVYVP